MSIAVSFNRPMTVHLDDHDYEAVYALNRHGETVAAIKFLKASYDLGLTEAKLLNDEIKRRVTASAELVHRINLAAQHKV
jgi:ribosomal protein L7/L12